MEVATAAMPTAAEPEVAVAVAPTAPVAQVTAAQPAESAAAPAAAVDTPTQLSKRMLSRLGDRETTPEEARPPKRARPQAQP